MSSYKNQHTVPQTYLKSWADSNSQSLVWYYNNLKKTYYQANVDKILYEYYIYSLTLNEDLSINENHFLTDEDFNNIFSPIKTYEVKYNGQTLKRINALADNYLHFDEWVIFDDKQKQISLSNKNDLKKRINNSKSQRLEKRLSTIENKWECLKEKIENLCNCYISNVPNSENQSILNIEDIEYLKLFIDLQYSRTPMTYDTYLQISKFIMNSDCFDFITESNAEIPARAAYLKMIDRGIKTNQFLIGKPLKNFNTKLLIAGENQYFLTSDNPVFKIEDSYYNGILQQQGIYLPISPQIVAVLFGNGNQLIATKNIPDTVVNSINLQIISNSQKGFVSDRELKGTKYMKVDNN